MSYYKNHPCHLVVVTKASMKERFQFVRQNDWILQVRRSPAGVKYRGWDSEHVPARCPLAARGV